MACGLQSARIMPTIINLLGCKVFLRFSGFIDMDIHNVKKQRPHLRGD
jgi:hypothetical protein